MTRETRHNALETVPNGTLPHTTRQGGGANGLQDEGVAVETTAVLIASSESTE